MTSLIKHSGQVFTPDYLVKLILDEAGYCGVDILSKHCIDNSCGDGAFLCEIVTRYVAAYREANGSDGGLATALRTYIHGIELDPLAYRNCLDNMAATCQALDVDCNTFDVYNEDTLASARFDGKMDFVVGNPPYVRVHNLEDTYDAVKSFSFAAGGMTDLYLVFFEKGFKMLREHGRLCYITPSSWLNSVAGGVMRDYIRHNHNLAALIDLEHFQAFKATTYTLISLFVNGRRRERFAYNVFDPTTMGKRHVEDLTFAEIDINSYFYLADHSTLTNLRRILTATLPRYVTAKNGFATLADDVFISSEFPFNEYVIPTIKASTGKWYKAFFPYDNIGKPVARERIFGHADIANYLADNKKKLLKTSSEANSPQWYLFGRTQALKDVYADKLAVNTTIKDIKSLKVNLVPSGSGLYSGLYILSEHGISFDTIRHLILSDHFISYIASLKKYKSGGYYTYNSKDLEAYLNYSIQQLVDNGTVGIASTEQQYNLFASNY